MVLCVQGRVPEAGDGGDFVGQAGYGHEGTGRVLNAIVFGWAFS